MFYSMKIIFSVFFFVSVDVCHLKWTRIYLNEKKNRKKKIRKNPDSRKENNNENEKLFGQLNLKGR